MDPLPPKIYCFSAVPEFFPLNLNLPHSFNFMREGYLRSLSLLPIFGKEIQVKQVLTSIIFKFSRPRLRQRRPPVFRGIFVKTKNIFVDIRFQELACLNFLLALFFFEKIKIRRNFILDLKWKRSINLKIIPRYLHCSGRRKFRFGFSLIVKKCCEQFSYLHIKFFNNFWKRKLSFLSTKLPVLEKKYLL